MSTAPNAPNTQMFSVNVDGETVTDAWNQAVPMPAHLAERVDKLQKRHHSTSPNEMENKMQQAAQNYKENLENTRSKAAKETTKVNEARDRRAEFGENMQLMGNAMGNKDASIKLPKALATRVESLAPKNPTTSSALMSKQAKAETNRNAALEVKKAKASASSAKVAAAKARKQAQMREQQAAGGLFELDASSDSNAQSGGWGAKVQLPARLQKRVNAVNKHFDYDVMEREARTKVTYERKQAGIVAKAKVASERVEEAKARRALAKGDDNHFTVTMDEDTDKAQGWSQKPAMPARLQQRLDSLKGKFHTASPNTRQERAAANRATFHKSIAAKGRIETEKMEAASRARALATGSASHFTVSEANFAASSTEDMMSNKYGWGNQKSQKLPERLQERLNSMNFAPKGDLSERQARAANKRSEFQRTIAMKAASESDRVAAVQQQQKLMKGDANTFTVSFDDEATTSKQGWITKPPLPNALKDRLATFKSSNMSMSTKQAKAEERRLAFQQNIVAKAAEEQDKAAQAASRRLVAQGDAKTLFSVSATNGSDEAKAGWGMKKSMPSHLQERLNTLAQQHKPRPHALRQAEAEKRRSDFLKKVANKASMETDKLNNAVSRKKLETGDANTFTVTLGAEDVATTAAQGWNQTQRLPARLQERLNELGETFKMAPYAAREEKASAKRAAFLTSLVSKASEESDKIADAASRRMVADGDDKHFTVAATDDEDAVVQQQGWGYKPTIPTRLQTRLTNLNKTFQTKETMETRQQRAEERRLAFQAKVIATAAVETDKCENAKSRKATIQGSDKLFAVNVGDAVAAAAAEEGETGWGIPTTLPAHLEARYKSLNAKFHGKNNNPMDKQKAAAFRRATHYKNIQKKAHVQTDNIVKAHSRKALSEGNDACFRVEFNTTEGADGVATAKGWGPGSPSLPKRLARRAADMIKISPSKNPFEAMNKAIENRDAYLEALVAKARQTSMKMEAARARKLRNEMDSGIILLNTKDQRKLSPVKLPARLSERVEQLTQRFGYDGAEREVRVEENRQRRLNEIRHKAAAASQRVASAKERRHLLARRQQIERISNPGAIATGSGDAGMGEEEEEDSGCGKTTRKSCNIC